MDSCGLRGVGADPIISEDVYLHWKQHKPVMSVSSATRVFLDGVECDLDTVRLKGFQANTIHVINGDKLSPTVWGYLFIPLLLVYSTKLEVSGSVNECMMKLVHDLKPRKYSIRSRL